MIDTFYGSGQKQLFECVVTKFLLKVKIEKAHFEVCVYLVVFDFENKNSATFGTGCVIFPKYSPPFTLKLFYSSIEEKCTV